MPFNIIDAIQSRLPEDVVARVAGSTGEAPAKARAGLSAGVFATVAGLIKHGATKEGAAGLLSNLKSNTPGVGLLGDRTDELSGLVSQQSGVSHKSAKGILGALGPIAGIVLGKEVLTRGLDAGGLSSLLLGQKKTLLEHPNFPSGFKNLLSGVGGGDAVAERVDTTARDVSVTSIPRERLAAAPAKSKVPWAGILSLVGLGVLLFGLLSLLRGRRPEIATPEVPKIQTPAAQAPRLKAPEVQAPVVQNPDMQKPEMQNPSLQNPNLQNPDLPNPELQKPEEQAPQAPKAEMPKAPEGPPVGQTTITSGDVGKGAGDLAEHFTGNAALPETFNLPKVNFLVGSTTMVEGSEASVNELATMMKDHPTARIRLEGYADQTGSGDINGPLSLKRAKTVKEKLVAQGVDADRIETVGKRSEKPVATNDTDEGRLENRRVDVVLLSR